MVGVDIVVFMLSSPVDKLEQSVLDVDANDCVVAGRRMLERALVELLNGGVLLFSSGLSDRWVSCGVVEVGFNVDTLSLATAILSALIVDPRDLSVEGKDPPPAGSSSDSLDDPLLRPVNDRLS